MLSCIGVLHREGTPALVQSYVTDLTTISSTIHTRLNSLQFGPHHHISMMIMKDGEIEEGDWLALKEAHERAMNASTQNGISSF